MNTNLLYKTFDQLLNEVSIDFAMYSQEGAIEPAALIKIAQKCNYDLGLRIHSTKEKVLPISHQKVKLPSDFYVINYAYVCGSYEHTYQLPAGRYTENVIVDMCTCEQVPCGCGGCGTLIRCSKCHKDPCTCEYTYAIECKTGEKIFVQVVEKRKYETRTYKDFYKLDITSTSAKCDAMNNHTPTAYIKNGFIYTNLHSGEVYISYEGALEDVDGNLLVLDHPMINEYYETSIKERILQNLYFGGEDIERKLMFMKEEKRAARANALSIVNTPDFREMYDTWKMNRKAQYSMYYDAFKSYDGWGSRIQHPHL